MRYRRDEEERSQTTLAAGNDALAGTGFTAQYDPGNRLANWTRPTAQNQTQTWAYDNSGNWTSTSKTIANNTTTENRQHNPSDQLTSIAGNAATHDAKGVIFSDVFLILCLYF